LTPFTWILADVIEVLGMRQGKEKHSDRQFYPYFLSYDESEQLDRFAGFVDNVQFLLFSPPYFQTEPGSLCLATV